MALALKIFEFNPFPVNTYLLYDTEMKDAVMIDAGMYTGNEESELEAFLSENGITVKALVNTHLHFDHCFGLSYMYDRHHLQTHAQQDDRTLGERFAEQAAMFGLQVRKALPSVGRWIEDGELLTWGAISLRVIHVPGHSPGGVAYYCEQLHCLFSGDVLFRRSIGRTDLPGGSYPQLIESIKRKLMVLPSDTIVYPGHGPSTTLAEEKQENFYLQ